VNGECNAAHDGCVRGTEHVMQHKMDVCGDGACNAAHYGCVCGWSMRCSTKWMCVQTEHAMQHAWSVFVEATHACSAPPRPSLAP